MSSVSLSNDTLKAQASRLGFVACGTAPAAPVQPWYAERYMHCMERGYFADMHYLHQHVDLRMNPSLLVPGVSTIVSLAMNYMPSAQQRGISLYAQGRDYHDVMRDRLRQLMAALHLTGRCFVDTAPIPERYWAWRCGIGDFCRNGLIAVAGYGPTVFLGELFILEEMDVYDNPLSDEPEPIEGWEELCPALTPAGLDARRCVSYQTIEHRGPLPDDLCLHSTFYGCDKCLRACEQFREVQPTAEASFQPSSTLLAMQEEDWRHLTKEQYQALFRGSAVKRAKYEGLKRNIERWKRQ